MSLLLIRKRLAQLAAHILVALIALVVIGGATRVMDAGLACPDWPLCFGSFFPGHHMNLQVFLEWFHRLDASLVGLALVFQFGLSWIWRDYLPRWILWTYLFLVGLVVSQGLLGALTVTNLLQSPVVTAHLALALTLVAIMSALVQKLTSIESVPAPFWWRFFGGASLLSVMGQCILGGQMATSWASEQCVNLENSCNLMVLHRGSAFLVGAFVLLFVSISLFVGGWPRSQWRHLGAVVLLLVAQINLGLISVHYGLAHPLLTIGHQLVAALLVAVLASLTFSNPPTSFANSSLNLEQSLLEPCHG